MTKANKVILLDTIHTCSYANYDYCHKDNEHYYANYVTVIKPALNNYDYYNKISYIIINMNMNNVHNYGQISSHS